MAAMGGPCEICGVMGKDQSILTCEKCSTREHLYCTKILLMDLPCSWICEQCDLKMKQIPLMPYQQKVPPAAKEVEGNKRGKETSRSLNIVKKKKVKYLSLEDVLKMPLGERGGSQFQSRRKVIPLMRQANKAKPHLQAKVRATETKPHVTTEKPPKMNPVVMDEAPTIQKGERKREMPSASTISHAIGGLSGSNLYKVATNKDDLEKKDALSDAITRAHIYRPHFPSALVTWTGHFKFPEDSPANSFGDITFYAVSPGKVSRKASELSLSLPPDLLVELIPLSQLVVNLFPNSNLDLRDVGIYFATKDAPERSLRSYKNLVECLQSEEIALRCCLDGAELFIFTSKILNSDSQLLVTSGLKNRYFLWGVYRCTSRGDRSSSKKSLFSESARQKDKNENSVCPDISSRDPEVEGLFRKEMAPSSMASVAGMESESCGIPGPSERIGVEVQSLSPAILEPRPKPQASVLMSESPANLKNWVTLDTSSAVRREKGTAGAGGIIYTSSGNWDYGFVFNLGRCNKREADLCALLQGLKLLWEKGYRAVRVRSDSESAMSSLKTVPSPEDPNGQLIIGCRDFLLRDWKCILSPIKVEENELAHQLAEQFEGYSLGPTILKAPPPELSRFFKGKDC